MLSKSLISRYDIVVRMPYLLIVLIMVVHFVFSYTYVSTINEYISDECWYVSSARNILVKVFSTAPKYEVNGFVGINVELVDQGSKDGVLRELVSLGGRVVKADYSTIPLVYVKLPSTIDLSLIYKIPGVKSVITGFMYPDYTAITDYLNTEHPPLFKYLIAASMMLCGDKPTCWRIPSIITSCLILLLTYLVVRLVIGGVVGSYLGIVAALLLFLDNLFRTMSVVAMIDITLSAFTMLTLYTLLKGKDILSYSSLGLATITKYNGLFTLPVILYVTVSRGMIPAYAIAYAVLIPLTTLLLSSLPLIVILGPLRWWYEAVENAVRWHLSIKTLSGPPTSAPWEWLLGINPFILHYTYVDGSWVADLVARGNHILYVMAALIAILILPVLSKLPDKGLTIKFTWLTFLMYVFIWVIGSRTQYSFYMIQITPSLYASLMVSVYWLTDITNLKEVLKVWLSILNLIVDWLLGNVKFKLELVIQHRLTTA